MSCRDNSSVGIRVADRWARSLSPNAEVIEIACGGGFPVTRTLVDAGLRIWAIDSSPTLIEIFQQRFPGLPAQCATALESDYFRKKFDAAISIGLIFLLNEEDQIEMLHRVSDILRPGASFLFTAPIETGRWEDITTGHKCISLGRETYQNALARAGLETLDLYEDSGKNNYYETAKIVGSVPNGID